MSLDLCEIQSVVEVMERAHIAAEKKGKSDHFFSVAVQRNSGMEQDYFSGCFRIEERNDQFEASFKWQREQPLKDCLKAIKILALKVTHFHHKIKNIARVSNLYRWKKQRTLLHNLASNSLC